eukprot:CAMPEP_0172739074 /NCGR_PEP_ID=MMETSP1074-20121228/121711_1 /TAXON_ID=2916 /ORGANISM="Ceratium fusus, Strain PA161109" /LENGTH=636 /DNA_ID=CAMNT_0013568853 /DNA_START=68 /DNA_END=1978 /DNA_ORIENTATION=+
MLLFCAVLLALPVVDGGSFARIHETLAARRPELEIIVVMSTTPSRLSSSLEGALASIFAQSLQPDLVVLSLPRGPLLRRPSESYPEDSELPRFLAQPRKGLLVDRDAKDEGPGTGLLNGLRHASRPDAYVIHLDDDHAYSSEHLAVLLFVATDPENQGTAVATVGLHSRPEFRPCLDHAAWTSGCVGRVYLGHTFGPLTIGWMGTVVQPWYFGPTGRWEAAQQPEWPDECRKHDDLWLGANLARRGVRRIGINWGLPGKAKELGQSRSGSSALYPQNRWNLLRCNMALLGRWPNLWEPRPRLVTVAVSTSAAMKAAADSCVGHIDQWFNIPVAVPQSSLSDFQAEISSATRLEHHDSVVLVFSGASVGSGWCSEVSAALQCAMAHPDTLCTGRGHNGSMPPTIAAATASAWRGKAISTAAMSKGRSCWAGRRANWRRCCWHHDEVHEGSGGDASAAELDTGVLAASAVDGGGSAGSRIDALLDAAVRAERQLRTVPAGCPRDASTRCCQVHPRLSRRWAPLAGRWNIQHDDGTERKLHISEEGFVRSSYSASPGLVPASGAMAGAPPAASEDSQLETTAVNGMVRLVAVGPSFPEANHSTEVWTLMQGVIKSVAWLPGGHVRVGTATPEGDCFGCV